MFRTYEDNLTLNLSKIVKIEWRSDNVARVHLVNYTSVDIKEATRLQKDLMTYNNAISCGGFLED